LGAKINPVDGCAGRGEIERRGEKICWLRAQIRSEPYAFILIYHNAQFYGCIPRERVNHVYFVFCVIDALLFPFDTLLLKYCDRSDKMYGIDLS
jgi:hypothetical protein